MVIWNRDVNKHDWCFPKNLGIKNLNLEALNPHLCILQNSRLGILEWFNENTLILKSNLEFNWDDKEFVGKKNWVDKIIINKSLSLTWKCPYIK